MPTATCPRAHRAYAPAHRPGPRAWLRFSARTNCSSRPHAVLRAGRADHARIWSITPILNAGNGRRRGARDLDEAALVAPDRVEDFLALEKRCSSWRASSSQAQVIECATSPDSTWSDGAVLGSRRPRSAATEDRRGWLNHVMVSLPQPASRPHVDPGALAPLDDLFTTALELPATEAGRVRDEEAAPTPSSAPTARLLAQASAGPGPSTGSLPTCAADDPGSGLYRPPVGAYRSCGRSPRRHGPRLRGDARRRRVSKAVALKVALWWRTSRSSTTLPPRAPDPRRSRPSQHRAISRGARRPALLVMNTGRVPITRTAPTG